jgi:RHS repeat-associated protein
MGTISKAGFTGAYLDPVTCVYPLGNGYRWYLPGLMRFNARDSLSPFSAGGINRYVYCAADPANHRDPSGHMMMEAEEFVAAEHAAEYTSRTDYEAARTAHSGALAAHLANPDTRPQPGLFRFDERYEQQRYDEELAAERVRQALERQRREQQRRDEERAAQEAHQARLARTANALQVDGPPPPFADLMEWAEANPQQGQGNRPDSRSFLRAFVNSLDRKSLTVLDLKDYNPNALARKAGFLEYPQKSVTYLASMRNAIWRSARLTKDPKIYKEQRLFGRVLNIDVQERPEFENR